jgi:hypothetical protein
MPAIRHILGMPADPTVDLPTTPGYFLSGGVGKEREWVLQLSPSIVTLELEWWAVSNRNGAQGTTTRLTDEEAARHLPLTRLEPVTS